jgi:hypothetical protein
MVLIAEYEVGETGSALGRVLAGAGVDAQLVRSFAIGDRSLVVLRVGREGADAFERAAAADRAVTEVRRVSTDGDGRLYRVAFADAAAVPSDAADWLDAGYTDGRWSVTARFEGREAFTSYRERLEEGGSAVTVGQLYDDRSAPDDGLTDLQRETLELAYERGFFEVPRATTMQELGEELGVSEQAVSQRLRRGYARLIEGSLF